MELWRISKYASLDGEGGRLYAGRWNSGGRPIVYLAASPPGALVEVLVHLEIHEATLPPVYTLHRITAPDSESVPDISPNKLWKEDETISRRLGDEWLTSGNSALIRVPSSILPMTFNYLFNPLHPDARKIKITGTWQRPYDPRLLRIHHTP